MTSPTTLSIDNCATYLRNSSTIRKWSPASKQLDVLERHTVECVERKIVKLQHAPGKLPEDPQLGEGFKVDALTKILPKAATAFYNRELHGPDLIKNSDVDRTGVRASRNTESEIASRKRAELEHELMLNPDLSSCSNDT